jgi:hypothetical protein
MGEYRDIDIHVNLKGHVMSKSVRNDVNSVQFEANRIIQNYVERYRILGWRAEGPTDFLSLFEDSRLTYKTASVTRKTRFISAKITFYRESSVPSLEHSFSLSVAAPAHVKRGGVPLWLVLVIVVAAVALYAVITQVIFKL